MYKSVFVTVGTTYLLTIQPPKPASIHKPVERFYARFFLSHVHFELPQKARD
jgi:hypothetical protein